MHKPDAIKKFSTVKTTQREEGVCLIHSSETLLDLTGIHRWGRRGNSSEDVWHQRSSPENCHGAPIQFAAVFFNEDISLWKIIGSEIQPNGNSGKNNENEIT